MITATLTKDQLEFLYKFISPVTKEVFIKMGPKGWSSTAVDPGHIVMVRFQMIPANFQEYTYDKEDEFLIGLQVEKLKEWYDALKAGHVTKAVFEKGDGAGEYSWAAQIDGLLQRKGKTLEIAGAPEPKWPKMTGYDTPLFTLSEAQAGELKNMIMKNPEYTDFLIQYDSNGLRMGLAKDQELKKKIHIKPDQLKEHGSKELEATMVNADYLRGIFKAVAGRPSNKDAVRFTFKSGSPIQIEFVKDNIREATYLLAPKLEEENTKSNVILLLEKEPKVQIEKETHSMPHYDQAGALKKGKGKKKTLPYSQYINDVLMPLLEDEVPLSQIIENTERVVVEWKIDENGEAFNERELGAREPLTLQQFRKDFDQLSVKPLEAANALDALEQDIKIEAKIAPEVKKFGEEVERAMQHPQEEALAKEEADVILDYYGKHRRYPEAISERAWNYLKKHFAEFEPAEEKAWTKAIEFYINEGMSDDDAGKKAWEEVTEQFPRLKAFEGALPHIKGELEEERPPISEIELVNKLRPFLPVSQFHLISMQLKGEEKDYFQKLFEQLIFDFEDMPTTYQTEKVPKDQKIVRMHYFTPSSDWYIIEKDKENEQHQAFGYAILNGDLQNAELGYISLEELKAEKSMNLDYHWKPTPLGKVIEEKESKEKAPAPPKAPSAPKEKPKRGRPKKAAKKPEPSRGEATEISFENGDKVFYNDHDGTWNAYDAQTKYTRRLQGPDGKVITDPNARDIALVAYKEIYERKHPEEEEPELEVPLVKPPPPPKLFTKVNLNELQKEAISKYAEYNWYLLREALEKGYDELAKQVIGDMSYNPCFRNLVRSDILQEKDRTKRMEKVEVAIDKWTDSVFTELHKRIDTLPGATGKSDIRMGPGTVLELVKIINPEYGIFVNSDNDAILKPLFELIGNYGLYGEARPGPGNLISVVARRVGDFCPGIVHAVQQDKDSASRAIDSARNMVKEAEAHGANATAARESLQKAQRSMARLDYASARDFAAEAEREASGAMIKAGPPKKAPEAAKPAPPTPSVQVEPEAYGNFEVRKTSRPAGSYKVWDTAQNDWSHGIPSDVDGPMLGNAPTYDLEEANIRAKMLAQWHEEKYAKDAQMRIIMEPTGQKVGGYMVYRFKRYEIPEVKEQWLQPPPEYGLLAGEKPKKAAPAFTPPPARPSPPPPKQVVAQPPPPKPIPPAPRPTTAILFQSGNFQVKQIGKYMVIDSLTQKTMAIENDLELAKGRARGFAEDRNRQYDTDAKFRGIVSKVGTTDDGMTIYKYGR